VVDEWLAVLQSSTWSNEGRPTSAVERFEDEHLGASTTAASQLKASRQNSGVVDDEEITSAEQFGEITDVSVLVLHR
jgi:hypothetical protein